MVGDGGCGEAGGCQTQGACRMEGNHGKLLL